MSGLFKILPNSESTIEVSTIDNLSPSDVYILVSLDLNEANREKILYSEGQLDGKVVGTEASLSEIEVTILAGGDTPEEVAGNVGSLRVAFANPLGGYIQYRPPEYSDSILSTYYRYLTSGPPRRVDATSIHQSPTGSKITGGLYRFTVKIYALATSNPFGLQTVISQTTVRNFITPPSLGNDPYLAIPASAIKGDGLIPSLEMVGSGLAENSDTIIHVYDIESGKEGKEFYDADLADYVSVYYGTGASYSTANRFDSGAGSILWGIAFKVQESSRKLLNRRCSPVFPFMSNSGDGEWEYRLHGRTDAGIEDEILTDWAPLANAAVPGSFWDIEIGESINVPASIFPFAEPLVNMNYQIGAMFREKTSTPGRLRVYGLLLLPTDGNSWIARFTSGHPTVDKIELNEGLEIDATSNVYYRFNQPNGPTHRWEKRGMPVKSLIMPKGDYQLRIISYGDGGSATGWYHDDVFCRMAVKGNFYTVYPFSET